MPVEDCDTIAPKGVAINKNKKGPSVERNENNNYIEEKIVIYYSCQGVGASTDCYSHPYMSSYSSINNVI